MAKGRPALGRGLSALLDAMGPEAAPAEAPGVRMVPVASIAPNAKQPRGHFDQEALAELTDSIRAKGVLVPLLVRPAPAGTAAADAGLVGAGRAGPAGVTADEMEKMAPGLAGPIAKLRAAEAAAASAGPALYELVAGERRWRAAQAAGLHEVPVVVKEMTDSELFEAALIENVQRHDLNPAEEAAGYRRLMDEFAHRQEDVSRLTGKSRSHVANLLRLLDLPDEVLDFMRRGLVSLGHAKVLMGTANPAELAREVVNRRMSVRALEDWVKRGQGAPRGPRAARAVDPDLAALEDAMEAATGLAVSVVPGPGKGGEVRIRYSGLEGLDAIVNRLTAS